MTRADRGALLAWGVLLGLVVGGVVLGWWS